MSPTAGVPVAAEPETILADPLRNVQDGTRAWGRPDTGSSCANGTSL
jgi:hypothetical protein